MSPDLGGGASALTVQKSLGPGRVKHTHYRETRALRAVVAEELGRAQLQPALSPSSGNRAPLCIWRNKEALAGGASFPQGFSAGLCQRAVDPSSKDGTSHPGSLGGPETYFDRKGCLLLGTPHQAAQARGLSRVQIPGGEGLCHFKEGSRRGRLTVPCCPSPQVSCGSLPLIRPEESVQLWTTQMCPILATQCRAGSPL